MRFSEVRNAPGSLPPVHTESQQVRAYGGSEMLIHVGGDTTELNVPAPDLPSNN
jgi:hypothetical protein